jgi:hypothetical protein
MLTPYIENGEYVPWIASGAVKFLDGFTKKTHTVFEVGAGGSTLWLAKRADYVISYENNRGWYDTVCICLLDEKCENVDLIYTADGSFPVTPKCDILFIDSKDMGDRIETAKFLYPCLNVNGILVIDDMETQNRYKRTRDVFGVPDKIFKGRTLMPESNTETAIWIKRNAGSPQR